jgi:hypothetical protein
MKDPLPLPKVLPDPEKEPDKLPSITPGTEAAAILGLARVAVQEGDLAEAVRRFDEYLSLTFPARVNLAMS